MLEVTSLSLCSCLRKIFAVYYAVRERPGCPDGRSKEHSLKLLNTAIFSWYFYSTLSLTHSLTFLENVCCHF